MIFRLCGKEKTPLVKQVNQVHGLTRWICNYHFVGVGFEKKVGKCFLFKVTWKFGKTKKRHVVKWNMTRSRFFPHLALKCLCCFGMFLFCPKFCFWKILETHIRKVRSLKNHPTETGNTFIKKKLMNIRTEVMFCSWHGGLWKTKQKPNALMVLFSTTTWDRIISHRIQWIL